MISREEMLQFGKRLRWIRSTCGLRQDVISDAASIDRSTLSYYESGALFPSMGKLCRLSAILATPLDKILGGLEIPDHLFSDDPFAQHKHPIITGNPDFLPTSITELDRNEQLLLLYFRLLRDDMKDGYLEELSERVEAIWRSELDEDDIVLREFTEEDEEFDDDFYDDDDEDEDDEDEEDE